MSETARADYQDFLDYVTAGCRMSSVIIGARRQFTESVWTLFKRYKEHPNKERVMRWESSAELAQKLDKFRETVVHDRELNRFLKKLVSALKELTAP